MSVKPTGYWIFFCNPKKWAIDEFLESGVTNDTFSITPWQKDWFKPGQLGIIRVGVDRRSKKELKGRPRLRPGVYAFVEITNTPKLIKTTHKDYWFENEEKEKLRYRVGIRYVKNLLENPIYLENLNNKEVDEYLIRGFQASSMPLQPETFKLLLNYLGNKNFDLP